MAKFQLPTQDLHCSIDCYNTCLGTSSLTYEYGIDYDENIVPLAKMTLVHTLINATATHGWQLYLLDIKNAFLHESPGGYSRRHNVCHVDLVYLLPLSSHLSSEIGPSSLGW